MAADDPGVEPDYRYTLANERRYLAWTRTALALIAGGVALRAFAKEFGEQWPPLVAAGLATALGGILTVLAHHQWRRTQIAMRLGQPMPRQLAAPLLTGGVVLIALVLSVTILQ